MDSAGVDGRSSGVFSSPFGVAFGLEWNSTGRESAGRKSTRAANEDGACVGGGAFVGGEHLDEATLAARESELTTLSAHLDAATHRQLTLIRIMDRSERWAQQGAKTCAAWLSWKIGLALGPAREHVRVANALAELPHIDDALRRGVLSYSKVRAMTRVATPANERKLLDAALETTAAQLEKICRGVRQQQREDGRPPEDAAPERTVGLRYRADGTVRLEAVLLPDEAARVMEALRQVQVAMREDLHPPPDTHPDLEAAHPDLADALTRIADDILSGAPLADPIQHAAPRSRGNAEHPGDPSGADSAGLPTAASSRGNAEPRDAAPGIDSADPLAARSRGNVERPVDPSPSADSADPSTAARSRGNAEPRDAAPGIDSADPLAARSRGNVERPVDPSPSADSADPSTAASSRGNAEPRDAAPGIDSADTSTAARSRGNAEPRPDASPDIDSADPSTAARSRGNRARTRTGGPDRAQVIVHLTEDHIDGGHGAFLDDGSRIAPATFRRLACDCGLLGVHEDQKGEPLDIGRKTRSIPPALHRAVLLRDQHCQFPGCTHDRHIDLHHIHHWIDGGPTSKANLIALCTFHHRLIHEGGFTLHRDPDGKPRFQAPDRKPLPAFHTPPPAPADPLEAFERAHADLDIHDETGLTKWDGDPIHYGDVVEVLATAGEPSDLDLPVRAWLNKHGIDA